MENNVQEMLDKKQDEIHYINDIIKNLNYLKELYSKGLLEDAKDLFSTCNALKSWEHRAEYVKKHIELIQSGVTPESLGNEVLDLSNFIGSSINKFNKGKDGIVQHNTPNISKKEWVESIQFIEGRLPSYTSTKNVFIDDDIIKNIKGFMLGPVGFFNNKAVEATNRVFACLQDLKDWVVRESEKSDMILYMTFEENGKYYWRGDSFLK